MGRLCLCIVKEKRKLAGLASHSVHSHSDRVPSATKPRLEEETTTSRLDKRKWLLAVFCPRKARSYSSPFIISVNLAIKPSENPRNLNNPKKQSRSSFIFCNFTFPRCVVHIFFFFQTTTFFNRTPDLSSRSNQRERERDC